MSTRWIGWTLQDARDIARELKPKILEIGFGIGLTGSVLLQERSDKDLDLIFYPIDSSKSLRLEELRDVFRDLGWRPLLSEKKLKQIWKKKGSKDTKHVEIWMTHNLDQRIDVFILR